MTAPLLALALALADPLGFPAAPPPPVDRPVATPAASAPGLPAATLAPPPAQLSLPSSGPGLDALILPTAALLALALAALFATRRRKQAPRLVHVLETASLGPKRALVVARIGDELLILGSSEAGLQLLAARPAGLEPATAEGLKPRLQAVPDSSPELAPESRSGPGLLGRLRARLAPAPAAPSPAFEALLVESAEDQELRRKLAAGHAGSVR